MRNDYCSNYLMHHGIQGQKWGVKNGPPYPLNASQKSSAEKKQASKTTNQKGTKSSGLTEDQRKTIRNVAIATAAVGAIAVGAYYANKYRNMHMDKILRKGVEIQHMSRKADEILNQPFYASYLKRDNKVYAANNFLGSNWTHKMDLKTTKNLKIAGKKTAEKTYKEWLNANPDAKARFGNASYFSFNRNLRSPDIYDKKFFADYYEHLKSKGYDAIHDWNDQYQSDTTAPLIIFGSLGDIKVTDITKVMKK